MSGFILLLVSVQLLFFSCSQKKDGMCSVQFDTCGLRNGDLVFRNGHGYESRVVTNLSSGDFSHMGIVYHDGRQWCVIHAVPGEAGEDGMDYLKCEPIAEFFRPDRAKAGARVCVACSDSIANAATFHALQLVNRKVLFDDDYDMEDTTSLYCTELVRLVYLDCGVDLCDDRWHRIPFHTNGPVIFPEDIWNSPLVIKKNKFSTF